MSIYSKKNLPAATATANLLPSSSPTSGVERLSPKLRLVKNLTDKEEYRRALDALSNSTADPEELNCRGVCLLRMREFSQAISPLRMVALNTSSLRLHDHVAEHIKLNYAIALFFGGEPGGGLDTLDKFTHSEHHPAVLMLRKQAKQWVAGMSLFRRLDWYFNRIAPPQGPLPPTESMGQFLWDLEDF